MKKEIGSFVVGDSTKCTGCKACELACFTVHNRKSNHLGKTVGTVTVPVTPRLFLTKFEQGCMPIQCKHCEDAPCLNACTKGAISRIDHQVIVDAEKCIGCKKCIRELGCPAIVLDNGNVCIDDTMCTGCGLCSQVCPAAAIIGGKKHE